MLPDLTNFQMRVGIQCGSRLLPSRVEVSKGVGDIAGHAHNNGPFTAQIFYHNRRQKHGGDDDGGVDDAQ